MKITGNLQIIMQRLIGLMNDAEYKDKQLDCEIKQHREKRSLTANAYYWQLLGQYADWGRYSKIRLHNELLAHYGQTAIFDGVVYTTLLDKDFEWRNLTDYHLRPTQNIVVGNCGKKIFRYFQIVLGSHTYDSYEMSVLIDGLISMIQGSGAPIETMTPQELALLKGYGYEKEHTAGT